MARTLASVSREAPLRAPRAFRPFRTQSSMFFARRAERQMLGPGNTVARHSDAR